MKTLLNSNLFPIISVAMYGTSLDSDNIFDSYSINDDKSEGYINYDSEYFNDNFDNNAYVDKIQSLASDFLNGSHTFNGIELTIKCGAIYSPKFYNFSNDEIDLTVTYNKLKVLRFAKENKYEFNTFLKENFSSYDGFSSSTANNFLEWLQDFKDNNVQSIGAILTYICKDEIQSLQSEFIENCFENLYYSEFVDTTLLDVEVNFIKKYVQENYFDIEALPLDLIKELFDFEVLNDSDIIKVSIEAKNEIEDHTLTLDL